MNKTLKFGLIFYGIITVLILGAFYIYKANAKEELKVYVNPLFDPIDPATGLKLPKDNKAPKEYTQLQNDMTMLYGRLDYIVNQLNQLQDTCGKK